MTDNSETCLLCGQPLTTFEITLHRAWHETCNKCSICSHGPLDEDMLTRQLARGQAIGHTGCIESQAMQDLKNKTIPMRIEQIEQLNREMNTQWIVEPSKNDIDALYKMIKVLHETTANVSAVLSRTKDKIQQSEVQKYREKTKEEKQAEREATRAQAQIEINKAAKAETLSAERADPALKLRRKALEGFMALGLTKEQAELQIQQMEKGKPQ